MKRNRFPRPDTQTIPISEGDTITVRQRLTAGEQRSMFTRMYLANGNGNGTGGGSLRVQPLQTGLAIVTAYLLDWTLTDDSGQVVPIRGLAAADLEAVIDALEPETFMEIKNAIEAHAERVQEARAQEKKLLAGDGGSVAISPSVSAPAGASSMSAPSIPTSTANS